MRKEIEERFNNILEATGDNGYNFTDRLAIEKELDYAEKMHKIEEEIGCSLEAFAKARKDGIENKGE